MANGKKLSKGTKIGLGIGAAGLIGAGLCYLFGSKKKDEEEIETEEEIEVTEEETESDDE